jgi:hypothetical protein
MRFRSNFSTRLDNSAKLINAAPHCRSHLCPLKLGFQSAAAVLACEKQRTLVRDTLFDNV